MLQQSSFRKHDFAAWEHQIHHDYQSWCFWQLKKYSNNSHAHTKEECSNKSTRYHFSGSGKCSYFHLMNFIHMYQLTYMSNSISFFSVLKKITSKDCLLTVAM